MARWQVVEGGLRNKPWLQAELDVVVDAYAEMFKLQELRASFVKAEYVREIMAALPARNKGSVEQKLSNISAVLTILGVQNLAGYRPRVNFQKSLARTVELRLDADPELRRIARQSAERDVQPLEDAAIAEMVPPPRPISPEKSRRARERLGIAVRRDYLALEARNRSVGAAGELIVVAFEKNRLMLEGRPDLAERVEHVSITLGDGLGFDIRSFSADGTERMIEVKATTHGIDTPFFVSSNEVARSSVLGDKYWVYRVFNLGRRTKLFAVQGAISTAFRLEPAIYSATP